MRLVLAIVLLALAPVARATEGFQIGLEGAYGGWTAPTADLVSAGIAEGDARLFNAPLDGQSRFGFNFHLGWNVLGWAAIEGTFNASAWSPLDSSAHGGAGLIGGRVTVYPAQYWFPERDWDVGLSFGGGWSIAGGPSLGMSGGYVDLGFSGEYYFAKWFSAGLYFRHYDAMWHTFYLDFNNSVTEPAPGFSAGYSQFGISATFHFSAQK